VIITIFATMIEFIHDFLYYLVFGSDLPYVKTALDPVTLSLILGGTKALTNVGQGIATSGRARRQREEGEKIAEQALQRLQGLDFETGPKLGVTQDTRDLAELQIRQSAEAMQNLRDQNLALSQQAIASGVMDPTRASQSIANIAPALSRQLGQSELSAAMQSTAAKQNLANLAEGYARANVLREQGVMDMNVQADRSLQERIRREGAQAAGLGFAAEGQAVGQMINAPAAGIDTGLAAFNLAQGLNPDGSNRDNSVNSGGVKRNIDGTLDFDGNPYNSRAKGGALSNQIYITGGEFNHDTNKKALIDEETGEKEAELTGDEAVLNPEQTDNTMQAFKILKDAIAKMENPPEELLAALEKMSHFDEPQFQVPQMEIEIA
tara:strand:- start:7069 stop:8205 length:1137 start_codon:yes stop_codon:yes gene_type:complete